MLLQSHSTTTKPKYTARQYFIIFQIFDTFRFYTRATIGNWRKSTPEYKKNSDQDSKRGILWTWLWNAIAWSSCFIDIQSYAKTPVKLGVQKNGRTYVICFFFNSSETIISSCEVTSVGNTVKALQLWVFLRCSCCKFQVTISLYRKVTSVPLCIIPSYFIRSYYNF